MTSYSKQIISTLLISIILSHTATVTSQVCPDPCRYSPPAIPTPGPPAGSNSPPSPNNNNLTHAEPPPAGSNSPPSPNNNNLTHAEPPPAGSNNPPPPYNLNNAPSPPDNMVPWFPYYYRRPLPNSDQSSSASVLISRWAAAIISTPCLIYMSRI